MAALTFTNMQYNQHDCDIAVKHQKEKKTLGFQNRSSLFTSKDKTLFYS